MADTNAAALAVDDKTSVDDIVAIKASVEEARRKEREANEGRVQAERIRDESLRVTTAEIGNRVRADELAISNAVVALDADSSRLKEELAKAYQGQDWKAVAETTEQLSNIAPRREALLSKQHEINRWKATTAANAQRQAQDPLAYYTPATREWLRAHPQVMTNPALGAKASAAHYEALEKGLAEGSPEYFNYADERLGFKAPAAATADAPLSSAATTDDAATDARPARATPNASVAAAPSRSSPSSTPRNVQQVKLTPAERDVALHSFTWDQALTDDQRITKYAEQKLALMREGRLNQNSGESYQ